jgi:phosphoglycerol transferase MdoB-like AlkP superfamily enzyme
MHLLGIPVENRFLMGVSMLSSAEKSVVFRNGGFTDGKVYFIPSDDGITGHGTCYSLPDGKAATDSAACAAGAEAAKRDLSISDRMIESNLISKFRQDQGVE